MKFVSETPAALNQRIRRLARKNNLIAIERGNNWYFGDERNVLCSPRTDLNVEEAFAFPDD
jgi:hypothetical protein